MRRFYRVFIENWMGVLVFFIFIIGVFYVINHFYEISQYDSLAFKTETTYMKDGYYYKETETECVMYDPNTIDGVNVVKRFQKEHTIEEDGYTKQKVSATDSCTWLWMPKSEEIYR